VTDGAHKGESGFGNIIVAKPNEIHSKTYISFEFQTQQEAESFESYLRCRLPNYLLSLRKSTQHTSALQCMWIPRVTLDRVWTDHEIYQYFKLTSVEIDIINKAKIIGYHPKPQQPQPQPQQPKKHKIKIKIKAKSQKES
jgi:hypothetical protein